MKTFFLMMIFSCMQSLAYGDGLEKHEQKPQFQRVGGEYTIKSIKPTKNGDGYEIVFHSTVPSGKADVIKLYSDHVHVGVQIGQTLRLSAEIDEEKGSVVTASQVLVFIPRPEGAVPVWMLSKKGRKRDLNGSKYLEMHAPQSDFLML